MRYKWEQCLNPEVNILHVDVLLPLTYGCGGIAPSSDGLDDEDCEFAGTLRAIHGVKGVTLHKYECQVSKGVVFAWEEIRPEVERLFKERFCPQGKMMKV